MIAQFPSIQSGDSYRHSVPKSQIPGFETGAEAHLALQGTIVYDVAAVESGDDLVFAVDMATSAGMAAGIYTGILYLKTATSRTKVSEFQISVLADYSKAKVKSDAEQQLEAIQTEIKRREIGGDASYTAQGTTITKISFSDLAAERDRLIDVVNEERRIRARKLGIKPRKIIFKL